MRFLISFLLVILFCNTVNAQFSETIRASRPGQAVEPFAVGSGVFQLQSGIDFSRFKENHSDFSGDAVAHNTFFRFGVTERFELSAAYEYRRDGYDLNDSTYSTNGLSLLSVGTRLNIYEGKGFIPAIGLDLVFKFPVLSKVYDFNHVAPSIIFIASNNVNDNLSWLLNVGTVYNGSDANPTNTYVINVGYTISPKWGTFVENYGSISNGTSENRWDTGLAYVLSKDLQLDIYGGAGKNSGRFDYFTSIGLSWRTVSLRNKSLK